MQVCLRESQKMPVGSGQACVAFSLMSWCIHLTRCTAGTMQFATCMGMPDVQGVSWCWYCLWSPQLIERWSQNEHQVHFVPMWPWLSMGKLTVESASLRSRSICQPDVCQRAKYEEHIES